MGFIDKYIFRDIFSPPSERDNLPSVYGGDGISLGTVASINCYSMPVANHLIDRFISSQYGDNGVGWKREVEYFVNKPEVAEFTIRAIGIVTTSGESHTFYFDVSQPMGASMNLVSLLAEDNISFLDRCLNVFKSRGE